MVQTIKLLWNKWQSLETWQQILLAAPFILLTVLILIYIISPIKSNSLDKEILKHNKDSVDKHIEKTAEKEEVLKEKQEKVKTKRIVTLEKVKAREKQANNIIKEIDDSDGDIDKLMRLHERLSTGRNSK